MADMERHPQVRHITVDSPTGPVEMMDRGVRFESEAADFGAVPALGQHGVALRQEFSAQTVGRPG